VHPAINAALQEWAGRKLDAVNYVHKGMNCLTEMYSAVLADVPIPEDPTTHLNTSLLAQLHNTDKVIA
jgi:nicotinamidase/pyrazinamidase